MAKDRSNRKNAKVIPIDRAEMDPILEREEVMGQQIVLILKDMLQGLRESSK